MKKDDLLILFLALILILAAVWTIIFGGERSRHGVGMNIGPENKGVIRLASG